MLVPTPLVLSDIFTKHVNKRTVHTFYLAIASRVVARSPRFMNAKPLTNVFDDRGFHLSALVAVQDFHYPNCEVQSRIASATSVAVARGTAYALAHSVKQSVKTMLYLFDLYDTTNGPSMLI